VGTSRPHPFLAFHDPIPFVAACLDTCDTKPVRTSKNNTLLNDYDRKQSARLVKEISEQPPMSSEELARQLDRLARQTQRAARKPRRLTAA